MNYNISEKLLDKVMENFFDKKFEGSVLETKKLPSLGESWHGFFKNIFDEEDVLLGHPSILKNETSWFFHGPYLLEGPAIFNISWNEFSNALLRYVNKKYPQLNITKVH